ncbi:DUF3826 domain-containing protein [Opitutus sp. ER46]|uniref:DUF3826 domain-containing protein n=1 Tax=Opitutus sp. ER46 TaxID=2161864 RepID=UPI001304A777|nr:DUF3826 domain-containing protein [Opitutus sp. ER46]
MTSVRFLQLAACAAALAVTPFIRAADDSAAAYARTTSERADKIVAKLALTDTAVATRVRDTIAQFYRDLNALQQRRDAAVSAAKANATLSAAERDSTVKAARDSVEPARAALRQAFLSQLAADLTPAQVDQVKDGLTYGVAPLTFRVYQEMLPNLTAEQKAQIQAWLLEARDLAIAGFTSDEKHGFFGKYKGRINNYLAKAGINMKQAEKEFSARRPVQK